MKVLTIILVVITNMAQAQFISVPTTTRINTPYGPATIPSQQLQYMPNYNFYNYGTGSVSNKYKFTIVLKNDSSLTAFTRINAAEKGQPYTVKVKTKLGKEELKPADTRQISRKLSNGKMLVGIASDSCWFFPTFTGKINGFSKFAETHSNYTIAIQKGNDGPILPLLKDHVKALLLPCSDPKVEALIENGKLIKAILRYNSLL